MSDLSKHNNPDDLNDDRLFSLLSQLRVPHSSMEKEVAWEKLHNAVKKEQRWDRFRIGFLRWGAAAVLLIIVSSIILEWQFSNKLHETPLGKIAYVQLPDSSRVTLNAGSTIKHREFGFKGKRVVKLNGEALFDVKSGKNEFVVIAGNHAIKVLGTRFNVYFRNNNLEVKCISGMVEVKMNESHAETLKAGQGISISQSSTDYKINNIDIFQASLWTKGEFYYAKTPLNVVFDEVMRQFNIGIICEGFNPQNRLYSGYFTNENINIALDLICVPMGLSHEFDSRDNVIRIYQNN
jgi:ferric-dicitrate binding protein FerR (iron transport regulator)